MAGYFIDGCHLDNTPEHLVHQFHLDTPNLMEFIKNNRQSRVLTFQVDGHELEAVLWGLRNYDKLFRSCDFLVQIETNEVKCSCGHHSWVTNPMHVRFVAADHRASHEKTEATVNIIDNRSH